MPTRKQRRRQQKERRHEYEYVYVDDEGNEVEAEPDGETSDAKAKSQPPGVKPTAKQPATRGEGSRRRACAAQDRAALVGARRPPRGDLRADHGDRRLLLNRTRRNRSARP